MSLNGPGPVDMTFLSDVREWTPSEMRYIKDREARNKQQKELRAKRKREGLCQACGITSPFRTLCYRCAELQSQRTKRYKERKREQV